MHHRLPALLAATIFIVGSPAQAESAQDIIGIKTGMTPEQVRSILSKRFPGIRIEENSYGGGTTPGPLAIMVVDHGAKGQHGHEEEVLVRFTATTGKAYWIERNINKEAPMAVYERAVFDKYGAPRYTHPIYKTLQHWNWDARGKPVVTTNTQCLANLDRYLPSYVDTTCGVGITAQVVGSQVPGTASRLRVGMLDSAVLTEEIKAAEKARFADPRTTVGKPAM